MLILWAILVSELDIRTHICLEALFITCTVYWEVIYHTYMESIDLSYYMS